jgi:hypothetical protein
VKYQKYNQIGDRQLGTILYVRLIHFFRKTSNVT